jgi:hypothetical protein
MKCTFSINTQKLIEIYDNKYDIYYFLKEKGFNHKFNWANYLNKEILISKKYLPTICVSGSLDYVINFKKDTSEIFVDSLADDIQLYWDDHLSEQQVNLINSNKRISVKQLEKLKNVPVDFLYGFCVDSILPKDIFSWSIYMTIGNGESKLIFNEEVI